MVNIHALAILEKYREASRRRYKYVVFNVGYPLLFRESGGSVASEVFSR
jgi:hypothetical protein